MSRSAPRDYLHRTLAVLDFLILMRSIHWSIHQVGPPSMEPYTRVFPDTWQGMHAPLLPPPLRTDTAVSITITIVFGVVK